jgi:hypothetical protein
MVSIMTTSVALVIKVNICMVKVTEDDEISIFPTRMEGFL